MLNYITNEISRLHDFDPNVQSKVNWDIVSIANMLQENGHVGPNINTGKYIANVLTRVLSLKPVTPLTGHEDEWEIRSSECTPEFTVFVNKRCPSIIKRVASDTNAAEVLDYDAVVISSDGGLTWWEPHRCYAKVEFPYVPPVIPSALFVKEVGEEQFEVITDQEEVAAYREECSKRAALNERAEADQNSADSAEDNDKLAEAKVTEVEVEAAAETIETAVDPVQSK